MFLSSTCTSCSATTISSPWISGSWTRRLTRCPSAATTTSIAGSRWRPRLRRLRRRKCHRRRRTTWPTWRSKRRSNQRPRFFTRIKTTLWSFLSPFCLENRKIQSEFRSKSFTDFSPPRDGATRVFSFSNLAAFVELKCRRDNPWRRTLALFRRRWKVFKFGRTFHWSFFAAVVCEWVNSLEHRMCLRSSECTELKRTETLSFNRVVCFTSCDTCFDFFVCKIHFLT